MEGREMAATPSGAVSADAVVTASPALLHSVVLVGGSDQATVILYDNATGASGTTLVRLTAAANATTVCNFTKPINATAGMYADVAGTSMFVYVGYSVK